MTTNCHERHGGCPVNTIKGDGGNLRVLVVGYAPPEMEQAAWAGLNSIATQQAEFSKRLAASGKVEVFMYGTSGRTETPAEWCVPHDGYLVFRPLEPRGGRAQRWTIRVRALGARAVLGTLFALPSAQQVLRSYPGNMPSLGNTIRTAFYLRRITEIVRPHLVHVHEPASLLPACRIAAGAAIPIIATFHGIAPAFEQNPDRAEVTKAAIQASLHELDAAIAVSNYTREEAIQLGCPSERVTVIPNGVDCSVFVPRSKEEARARLGLTEVPTVLFCGSFDPRKRINILLEAFRRLQNEFPSSRLILVGAGQEEERLRQLASDLGLHQQQVIFTGKLPNNELPWWYAASDVVANPSSAEGLAVAMLEAMACGRLVIACPPPLGAYDPLIEGQTGLFARHNDSTHLASQIKYLWCNPEMATRMGQAARQLMVQEYDYDRVAPRLEALYRQVVALGAYPKNQKRVMVSNMPDIVGAKDSPLLL